MCCGKDVPLSCRPLRDVEPQSADILSEPTCAALSWQRASFIKLQFVAPAYQDIFQL